MPKGSKLIEYEKDAVQSFALSGISCWYFETETGRSKTVINNFLRLKDEYREK